jgi:ankyrin repeat protein
MSQEDSDDDMSSGSQEDSDDNMSSGSQDDSDDMSSPQKYAELARMLLEHGADVTGRDKDGRTPFDLASSDLGHAEVAHVLLEHGAVPSTHENVG